MEFITLIIGLVMMLGVYQCSDKSRLELQIVKQQPFEYGGREYVCKNTDKQLKIDELNQKIREVKGND